MMRSKGLRRSARKLSYARVRKRIETGDILLFKGKGPLSAFIRWGTGSDYSHSAIASWEGDRLMIYQAVGRGVNHVPAREEVYKYDGQVDWWSVRPEYRDEIDRAGIIAEAGEHIGKPFAIWGFIKLAFLIMVGRYKHTADDRDPPEAMFCSWYVATAYRVGGGFDVVPVIADHCTSPAEIENSPHVMIRGVLHEDTEGTLTDEPAEQPADGAVA